ncbi:hypothetical protein CTM89_21160, partial [Photobacterium leiognathi]
TTLAQSGLDVAYQWQQGSVGGGWSDITDADLSSYTAQSGDVGDALRLCLTLTDLQSGLSEETCSDPTQAVTDNATGYALRELKLNLNGTTDTLSLAADSTSWLDNLLATESLTASYQWYRVPDGGSVDSGGLALGSASPSYSDYALMGDDDGYRHALRVTLSNSDEVNSELSTVWGGAGSTAPNSDGTFQDLYQDVVRIQGVSSPYGVGDTLSAQLMGSSASNDLQPDSVMYQWQRVNTMSPTGWDNILGAMGSNYQVVALDATAGQLRVIATPTVNGIQLTDRVSLPVNIATVVTARLGVTIVPTSAPINQGEALGVSVIEQPIGANLSYQWYRLSGAVGSADSWPASAELSGATSDTYTAQSADQGNYLGVKVTDSSGSGLSTSAVSVGRVASSTTNDIFGIVSSLTPDPIYEQSVPDYQAQLTRNGVIDSTGSAAIVAEWYLVDSPAQAGSPTTWQALATPLSNTSLQSQAGRYVLLSLSYSDNGQVVASDTLVSDAIESGGVPATVNAWFGGLAISPDAPASIVSVPSLFSQNGTQVEGPDANSYTVTYVFVSDDAP